MTCRTAHELCFASVPFFSIISRNNNCVYSPKKKKKRSNLLRDGEPADDNVDRSDRGYVPVQPLAYDHGVSLIPLSSLPDSDDFTIGHHELQVRNGWRFAESEYRPRGRGTLLPRRKGCGWNRSGGLWKSAEDSRAKKLSGPCFRPCTTALRSCTGTLWRAVAGPPGCFCDWKGTARRWRGARPRGARWNAARPDRPTIRWSPTVKTLYPTRCSTGRPSVARRSWVSVLRPRGWGPSKIRTDMKWAGVTKHGLKMSKRSRPAWWGKN